MSSACTPAPQTLSDFADALVAKHGPFPVSASLELTARCNLRCRYCYMVPYRDEPELTTDEVLRILDDLARAGCLGLLLTGGEPLLRPDFETIWRAAKAHGFLLSLYTNATLVTEAVAELLRGLPPLVTEVSLYGGSPATYDRQTGSADAFGQAVRGIERLRTVKTDLHVKAPVLRGTRDDLPAMTALAQGWDLPLYVDTEVFPRLDGDLSPLEEALPLPEAIGEVVDEPLHREVWTKSLGTKGRKPSRLDKVVVCRGGERSVHIGPYGDMCLCMLLREPSFSLRRGSFRKGWRTIHETVREQACAKPRACVTCEAIHLCVPCAGKNRLATGDPETPAPFVCARVRAIAEAMKEGTNHAQQSVGA